jgi:hypothetical protein
MRYSNSLANLFAFLYLNCHVDVEVIQIPTDRHSFVASMIHALTRMPDRLDHVNFATKSARGKGALTHRKAQT